jgi:hypothetical protein
MFFLAKCSFAPNASVQAGHGSIWALFFSAGRSHATQIVRGKPH